MGRTWAKKFGHLLGGVLVISARDPICDLSDATAASSFRGWRRGQFADDLLRGDFVYFAVARDGLRDSGDWIAVPIVIAAVADEYRTVGRDCVYEVTEFHAYSSMPVLWRIPGMMSESISLRNDTSMR